MTRFSIRGLWPLAVVLAALCLRSAGCQKKPAPAGRGAPSPAAQRHWITPLLTPPLPAPTPTLWKGVTRVPALPE